MVSYQHQLKKDQSNVLRKDFNGAVRRDGSYSTFKYLRVSLVYHVQNHKGEGSCSFLVTFQTQSNTPPFGTHKKISLWAKNSWKLSRSFVIKITEAGTSAIHIYSWIVLEYPGLIIKIFIYFFLYISFIGWFSFNQCQIGIVQYY